MNSTIFNSIEKPIENIVVETVAESDENVVATSSAVSTVKKIERKPRGKKWCETDDELLCEAWIYTSEDGIKGVSQKLERYWCRIFQTFMERNPVNKERDVEALETRWRTIKKKTMEFCGKLAKVIALKTSGANEQDNFVKAGKLWADDNEGKRFDFMHCYDILHKHDKWKEVLRSAEDYAAKKRTATEAVEVNGDGSPVDRDARPAGRKQEKESEKKKRKMEELSVELKQRQDRLFESNQAILKALEAQNKQIEEQKAAEERRTTAIMIQNELTFLTVDSSKLSPEKLERYQKLQQMFEDFQNDQ